MVTTYICTFDMVVDPFTKVQLEIFLLHTLNHKVDVNCEILDYLSLFICLLIHLYAMLFII